MSKKLVYGVVTGALVLASIGLTSSLTTANFATAEGAPSDSSASLGTSGSLLNEKQDELVDETVYVFLNPDGSVRKTISSDWSKNDLGNDVYTKTTGQVTTPVSLKITYWLDGEEISASALKGKSGRVKIRYDYSNSDLSGGYHVPYTVLTGVVLPNDQFKNVSVTNGKLMNDGSRIVVAGVAFPGLQADLGISADKFNIPDFFEIEADATNFELNMTMSLATSKLFSEIDPSALDSLGGLEGQLSKLTEAMDALMSGSKQLYDGLSTLYKKSGTLADGVLQLKNGSSELLTGAKTLEAGLASAAASADTLITNMQALDAQSETLISSADTIFNATLAQAKAAIPSLTAENYEAVLTGAIQQSTAAGDAATVASLSQTLGLLQFSAGVKAYAGAYSQIAGAASALPAGLSQLSAGASSLATGVASLDAGLSNLNSNVPALQEGVKQLQNGSLSLSEGLQRFNQEGVQKIVNLYNGDLQGLSSRLKTVINLSKNAKSNVKYVYRTDEIN